MSKVLPRLKKELSLGGDDTERARTILGFNSVAFVERRGEFCGLSGQGRIAIQSFANTVDYHTKDILIRNRPELEDVQESYKSIVLAFPIQK